MQDCKGLNADTELVLVSEELAQTEVDVKVESVDSAVQEFTKQGGKILAPLFNIQIGRCAVVFDPWKNNFVILDSSKDLLKTDSEKNVILA